MAVDVLRHHTHDLGPHPAAPGRLGAERVNHSRASRIRARPHDQLRLVVVQPELAEVAVGDGHLGHGARLRQPAREEGHRQLARLAQVGAHETVRVRERLRHRVGAPHLDRRGSPPPPAAVGSRAPAAPSPTAPTSPRRAWRCRRSWRCRSSWGAPWMSWPLPSCSSPTTGCAASTADTGERPALAHVVEHACARARPRRSAATRAAPTRVRSPRR